MWSGKCTCDVACQTLQLTLVTLHKIRNNDLRGAFLEIMESHGGDHVREQTS